MEVPSLPRVFGKYVLIEHIGHGAMANIFLAFEEESIKAKKVVLKINLETHQDEIFSKLLVEEGKYLERLHHPNITKILDMGDVEGKPYLALEYIEGFDLHQLLRRCAKGKVGFPLALGLHVIGEVLDALEYAQGVHDPLSHESLHLVHRDIAPANVLLGLDGTVQLCDFGVAHGQGKEDVLGESRIGGRVAYMAPEVLEGDQRDHRSDIFSLGVLLWELCEGKRLFKGTEQEIVPRIKAGDISKLTLGRHPQESILQSIVDKAVMLNKEERFQHARDMKKAIELYASVADMPLTHRVIREFIQTHFMDEIELRRKSFDEKLKPYLAKKSASWYPIDHKEFEPVKAPETQMQPEKHPQTWRVSFWAAVLIANLLFLGALAYYFFSG